MQRLLVIGAGGFGRAVAELAMASTTYRVVGLVDDRWPNLPPVWGIPVLGRLLDLPALCNCADAVVIAIGDNKVRRAAFLAAEAAGFEMASVIHPRAIVAASAMLGRGLTVMAGAIIGSEASIGDGAVVNAGAVVDHQARVGAFAYLGVGACMPGGTELDAGCSLRAGQLPAT